MLLSWEIYGRQNSLTFINDTRYDIYLYYLQSINVNNFFLGHGKQLSVQLSQGGVTQAHNLILQWFVNWGFLGLTLLMVYLVAVLRSLKSCDSKMLMIAFLIYSMMQPVQGTANFFGPVTFLFFMMIIGLDNSKHRL
jgi:O-antigen ligase